MTIQRLTSLGFVVSMLAAIGCGGSGGTGGTGGSTQQTTKYSLTIAPTALSLPPGGTQDVVVTIDRGSTPFAGAITFSLNVPDTIPVSGVTASINPNPATADTTTIGVGVASTVLAGSYTLQVVGTSGADTYTVNLPLTVTGVASTLLVDADDSDNNQDPTNVNATPSPSDTLFPSLLQHEAVPFNTFVVPAPVTTTQASTPAISDLTGYSTIVWYTGETYGGIATTVSPAQQAILEAWLDQGNHTLLIFSQNMVYDLRVGDWNTTPETNTFLANYVGATGSSNDGNALHNATYNVTGATGTPFAGEMFQVIMDSPLNSTGDVINPATGTDTLATVVENPDNVLDAPVPVAIVVGRKSVGAAHSSTVVYAGMPIENILMTVGNNNAQQLFHAALVYTGLKTP